MYHYESLEKTENKKIAQCLNLAFSDYYIPIKFDLNSLENFFKINGVNKKCSYGAFYKDELVGFIINSTAEYKGFKTVFDVGTGIVPKHRGNKVFSNLLSFAEKDLKKLDVDKYYLEVLTQNDKAISIYTKMGFSKEREFYVLACEDSGSRKSSDKIRFEEYKTFDFSKVKNCRRINPSYENSDGVVNLNADRYQVYYEEDNGIVESFCVAAKNTGNIVQIGYSNIDKLKNILVFLLSERGKITLKNIDIKEEETLQMLFSLGFKEMCRQYEMAKEIPAFDTIE